MKPGGKNKMKPLAKKIILGGVYLTSILMGTNTLTYLDTRKLLRNGIPGNAIREGACYMPEFAYDELYSPNWTPLDYFYGPISKAGVDNTGKTWVIFEKDQGKHSKLDNLLFRIGREIALNN